VGIDGSEEWGELIDERKNEETTEAGEREKQ
jgi:hypothetical protein